MLLAALAALAAGLLPCARAGTVGDAGAAGPAAAPADGGDRASFADRRFVLEDEQLDRIRGGFQTADGLSIAFGIESAVYVNGELKTTTTLQVATGGVPTGPGALPGVSLVQNGAGNTFVTGAASPLPVGGVVIQNTLDNQTIQHITSINATVNSAQVLKAQGLESALRGALVDSLRR
ncbi:hypothetical protein CLD22_23835 [Rubrivivax gelatinosus]|nr:hypothetical protein [Rubrivivax gelatinosus]